MMRSGFTLIELVVVVVVMGILSCLAVITLGGTTDRYQLSRATETIELFDARARRDARRLGEPIVATIQRSRNQLMVSGDRAADARFRLPQSVEITQIRMRRRVVAGRDVEIPFNRQGVCPTYAVQIQRGKLRRWVVVLGLSGQVVALNDQGEVDEILSL